MDSGGIALYTIEETAHMLRVHRSTVSRLLMSGSLPHLCVGKRKLVRHQDLVEFIDRQIRVGGGSGLLSEAK